MEITYEIEGAERVTVIREKPDALGLGVMGLFFLFWSGMGGFACFHLVKGILKEGFSFTPPCLFLCAWCAVWAAVEFFGLIPALFARCIADQEMRIGNRWLAFGCSTRWIRRLRRWEVTGETTLYVGYSGMQIGNRSESAVFIMEGTGGKPRQVFRSMDQSVCERVMRQLSDLLKVRLVSADNEGGEEDEAFPESRLPPGPEEDVKVGERITIQRAMDGREIAISYSSRTLFNLIVAPIVFVVSALMCVGSILNAVRNPRPDWIFILVALFFTLGSLIQWTYIVFGRQKLTFRKPDELRYFIGIGRFGLRRGGIWTHNASVTVEMTYEGGKNKTAVYTVYVTPPQGERLKTFKTHDSEQARLLVETLKSILIRFRV